MRALARWLIVLAACGSEPLGPDPMVPPPSAYHQLGAPIVTLLGATPTSVSFEVCATRTGLLGGFSMQWLRADGFAGWPGMFDGYTCGVTFGPRSRFALRPHACTQVDIGRLVDEEPGVEFTCDELTCATEYVFRAYAEATATASASTFSDDELASTLPCDNEPCGGCTYTQGYWKNHADWPRTSLAIGENVYTEAQLSQIFDTPARGNGLVALAHQTIAAKLNIANGANGASIETALASADQMIGSLWIPPIGTGYLAPATTSDLTDTLADFNEGETGPGHCDDP